MILVRASLPLAVAAIGIAPLLVHDDVAQPPCLGGFEIQSEGVTRLDIPKAFATPACMHSIATQFGDVVATPTPAWRWTLASQDFVEDRIAVHGTVSPVWWPREMTRSEHSVLIDGTHIYVDALATAPELELTCDHTHVVLTPTGVGAYDSVHDEFRWLWRGFPVAAMQCIDDLLVLRPSREVTELAVVDIASGGWLLEPGARLWQTRQGVLWQRADGKLIELERIAMWLQSPATVRGSLDRLMVERRELTDDAAAAEVASLHEGDLPAPGTVSDMVRATLPLDMECMGWTIRWSSTAVLAESGKSARWLLVEPPDSARRVDQVACTPRMLHITDRRRPHPLSGLVEPYEEPVTIGVDLARGRYAFP